jgi:hypothetical protein
MRGFYVMRMKKDQRTGHYVGVATWISRNDPLPGNRTFRSPNNGNGHAEPVPQNQIRLEEHPSHIDLEREIEQSTERPYQAPEVQEMRSEIPQPRGNENSDRKVNHSWYSDDAYEL